MIDYSTFITLLPIASSPSPTADFCQIYFFCNLTPPPTSSNSRFYTVYLVDVWPGHLYRFLILGWCLLNDIGGKTRNSLPLFFGLPLYCSRFHLCSFFVFEVCVAACLCICGEDSVVFLDLIHVICFFSSFSFIIVCNVFLRFVG